MRQIINCYTLKDLCDLVSPFMLTGVHLPEDSPVPDYEMYDEDLLMTLCDLALKPKNSSQAAADTYPYQKIMGMMNLTPWELFMRKKVFTENKYSWNITPYTKLFRLIRMRFEDEYCVSSNDELYVTNESFEHDFDGNKDVYNFANKFLGILFSTKDKYINILNIYDENMSKLMDGLKSTTEASHEVHRDEDYDTDVNGKNLFSDAPATTDVVSDLEAAQYVSELSKSDAHTDNVGDIDETGSREEETTIDHKYAMEKIKDIQDSYEKVLKKWSDEFSPLFKEEA